MTGQPKRCGVCGETKVLDEFHKQTQSKDGHQPTCKPCARTRAREWYRANRELAGERSRVAQAARYAADPEKFRARHRAWSARNPERTRYYATGTKLKRYGLTRESFEAMLAAQGGRCDVCRTNTPGGAGTWHVDHDHRCCPTQMRSCGKCVRSLLCSRCNTALGLADDDPQRLMSLAHYLLRHQAAIANL